MDFQTPEEIKLIFLMFLTMIVAATLIACTSEAGSPSSAFVFSRLTSLHGHGVYAIEDDVSFHEDTENVTIHENWIVIDGGEMRVLAKGGDGTRVFRLLKKGRVYFVDDSGSERSEEASADYFMRPLLTRTANDEKRIFFTWGVLPAEALQNKKFPKDLKDFQITTEPFVRPARVAGTIAWAYGKPAPVDGPATPGVWVEQDQFVLRKLRTPDGAEAALNDYGNFSKGSKSLSFPKEQIISFDNHVANIRVTRVAAVSQLSPEIKKQFDVSWLRGKAEAQSVYAKSALGPVVQEFYHRFR